MTTVNEGVSGSAAMLNRKLCPWLQAPLDRLESARNEGRLGHAWLIHGPEGAGKLNLALVFATRLLERARDSEFTRIEPDEFLRGMDNRHEAQNHHPDLHHVYPEAGKYTITVEQIRDVCEALELSSYSGSAKVVVIEPAEAMTTSASNALLKTLEEPTPGTYLLLVSHRPGLLPATVRSRCQRVAVSAPGEQLLTQWANQQIGACDALQSAAPQRTPLQLLEMFASEAQDLEKTRCTELTEIIERRRNAMSVADDWSKGDVHHTLALLVRMLHGLIRLRFIRNASKLITESGESRLHNAAQALSVRALFERLDEAERLRSDLAGGINVQLAMRALLLGFLPDEGTT